MKYNKEDIKNGITLHLIDTDKFKTNLMAIFLTTPITREYVTYDAVLSAILRRGSKNIPTQEEISRKMEEMYGASFDTGIDKTGDNHILKFYLETINDEFIPQNDDNMLKQGINILTDIVFNPLLESEKFKEEYLNQEKENIRQRINGKIDNKALYARQRCTEEMYKGMPAGLYRFGYVEDLDKINASNLYEYYKKLLNECKIDIFVSGKIENVDVKGVILSNENIKKLSERNANYIVNKIEIKEEEQEKNIVEQMDVTQGKIVIGTDIIFNEEDLKDENIMYQVMVYNGILGGNASSKMFQNVREKASLAYTASSSYVRYKSNIFIVAGIEIPNYEKALKIIKEQIEDMRNGVFTDEDIENSKKVIISAIDSIDDEQDTEITYFLGQEILGTNVELKDYMDKICKVDREQIINIAKKININTIYFLRNKEENDANN